jgi:hypothetical protein
LLLAPLLALCLALATFGLAAAQQSVGVTLDPQAGSGVSGEAAIGLQGATAPIDLSLMGLTPGASYPVNLQSGTCELPSASFGRLGSVTADAGGRGQIQATSATGAAGAPVTLTPELVFDGNHILTVLGQNGVVACGAIPWWGAISSPGQLPAAGGLPLAPLAAGLGTLGLFAMLLGWRLRR